MKKALAFILSLVLVLSLCACGGGGGTDAPKANDKPTAAADTKPATDSSKPTDNEASSNSVEGEWTGLCQRTVGDGSGDYETPFTLILEKGGKGKHLRDDLEIDVTWTQNGNDVTMKESYMGMEIDYTGHIDGNYLSLYNGDPTDDFTYEYYYGRGDDIVRPEPPLRADAIFTGDWQGLGKYINCTGAYADIEGNYSNVIARFLCNTGGVNAFIGLDAGNYHFTDLDCDLDFYENTMTIDGTWGPNYFYNVVATVENGTMHFEIPVEDENGSFLFVVNVRRFGDQGWTNEDPGFSKELQEYYKDFTLEYIAEYFGFTEEDIPTEYPSEVWW